MFVPAESFDKLEILRVIPLDAYAREEYGEAGWIETELEVEFDTGEPIEKGAWGRPKKLYRGYHYPGPDVRDMSSKEAARLKRDLRAVKRSG